MATKSLLRASSKLEDEFEANGKKFFKIISKDGLSNLEDDNQEFKRFVDDIEFKDLLNKANANWRDTQTGETPLIRAARLGCYEFVQILLEEDDSVKHNHEKRAGAIYHADVSLQDFQGMVERGLSVARKYAEKTRRSFNTLEKQRGMGCKVMCIRVRAHPCSLLSLF
mmetsp:Transcript_10118/g.14082  ORF Transcript_10118/g.14082 Transcript_10118/m.14082 type:complete len:168 (+) Transcript_10118:1-504(+)